MEVDQLTSYHMFDPDFPDVVERREDVGLTGSPLVSLKDYEILFEGIPVEKIYTHPGGGCIQFAPFAHACYFSLALKRGIPLSALRGTGQNDYFLSYLGCPLKNQIHPKAGIRLNADFIEFCLENVPEWVPVSIPGYNASESGANAYQELALVFANAIAYIEEMLRRGKIGIDDFAPAIAGVNFACGRDFFEDIAKLRAARRMWYKLLSNQYGCKDERGLKLRIHGLTVGSFMSNKQPFNNIVRGTMMGLTAALGGVQSLGVSGFDEAISIPSELAHLLSVRTQQILQLETNITSVVDPLGGSYFIESLTNELEEKAWQYLQEIKNAGGFIKALDSGWMHREVAKGMVEREKKIRAGELKWVGINCYQMEEEPSKVKAFRTDATAWDKAMRNLEEVRKNRDNGKVQEALAEVREACLDERKNIMPPMLKAVQAYATIGEVGDIFRKVFSIWTPPIPL
jgi:methylmalonyl-CoA mutase N-terminal domain/subunit